MARNNQRGGSSASRRAPKDLGRRVKKKPCALCRDKVEWVDYKDVPMLRKYMSDRGKIRSRRVTGNCAQHQRALAMAIKTARELVLLPYTQRTVTERPGGRGGGRDRGERTLGDSMASEARRGPAQTAQTAAAAVEADPVEALAIVEEAAADAEAGVTVEVVVEPAGAGADA
jgi:small subunit ribosomal protein S18